MNKLALLATASAFNFLDLNCGIAAGPSPAPTSGGNGVIVAGGQVQIHNTITQNATSGGTVTISLPNGTDADFVNLPTNGGTVTLLFTPTFATQRTFVDIAQGATPATVLTPNVNWGSTVTGYTASAVAGQHDHLLVISPDGTHTTGDAIAQGFSW